jgi:FkbM family methyltransferase
VPAASFFHRIGADEISRKISSICGYIPPIVDVHIRTDPADTPSFRMHSVRGTDQVARTLWWEGWGKFEPPMPDLFAAFCRESRFVLDVGAYSGLYSLIAASCPHVTKCYAFEPLPEVRESLERNVKLNALGDRIEVVPSAVCDQAGEAEFYIPATKTGLMESSSSLNGQFRAQHLRTLKVPLLTLDDYTEQKGCHPVDLMKIDVETQEHRVLLGARRILREDRPLIFIEILREADCDVLEAIRAEFGYACGLLLPEGVQWREKVEYVRDQNDQCLCPVEKLDRFNQVIESTGYRLL